MRETAFGLALRLFLAPLILSICVGSQPLNAQRASEGAVEPYLRWTVSQAKGIGKRMYGRGRVGGLWDVRVLKTERAINYKLAATWLTPEVIRATARFIQLRDGLTDDQTRALVAEAEAAGDTVVMVELDPREGSGVIPREWRAYFHPKGAQAGSAYSNVGINKPSLRKVEALQGVRRRNYAYDRFWIVFPLTTRTGEPLFPFSVAQAELVIRVYNKQGRVRWRIPPSVRKRMESVVLMGN